MKRFILALKQAGEQALTIGNIMIVMFIPQRVDSYIHLSNCSKRDVCQCFFNSILLSLYYSSLLEDPVEVSHTIKKGGSSIPRKKLSSVCSSVEQLTASVEEVSS